PIAISSYVSGYVVATAVSTPASRDDALTHRIQNQFRRAVQIQLLQYVRAMRVYGIGTDIQNIGDFLIRFALGDQLQDLALATGQQIIAIVDAFRLQLAQMVVLQQPAYFPAQKRPSLVHRADAVDEIAFGGVLHQVSASAGI